MPLALGAAALMLPRVLASQELIPPSKSKGAKNPLEGLRAGQQLSWGHPCSPVLYLWVWKLRHPPTCSQDSALREGILESEPPKPSHVT